MRKFTKILFLFVLLSASLRVLADDTSPIITLLGNPTVSITVGNTYVDAGATASDDIDGNITTDIITVNPVNTAIVGAYTVTYDVKDTAGNSATEVSRTVTVNPAPIINVNLTIRDDNTVIGPITVPLETAGTITLDGHSLNADSVLSVLNDASNIPNSGFSISDLQYYDSMSSFYLNCITDSIGKECANWQYTVNGSYPSDGMDKTILSGGENVYLYFGPEHKVILSANSITTADTLTATTQNYHYQDNTWLPLTGVTIGLTQPNPTNTYNPTEVQTKTVDSNGMATFSAIPTGSYNVGIQQDYYYSTENLIVTTPPVITPSSDIGSGSEYVTPKSKPVFNIAKATNFLLSQQKNNGTFGEDLYTDWVTLALASNSATPKTNLDKIAKYFSENKFSGINTTDYERHAMALMALGLNPYNTNNENYVNDIISKFDGTQFGDKNSDNDDIFALIVLQNAGYKIDDKIISDDISFILSKQKADGSWDESIDLTGAGIEALVAFNQNDQVKNALTKAEQYLKQNQKTDGGWQNVSSTAWAMEGILALGEKPEDWIENENTPLDYLTDEQDTDGGIKNADLNSRIWETAYALTSLSGKTWNQIMQKFDKPTIVVTNIKNSDADITKTKTTDIKTSIKIAQTKNTEPAIKINNINNSQSANNLTSTKKQNWFMKFLSKIFHF